jgi:hypothetical protein
MEVRNSKDRSIEVRDQSRSVNVSYEIGTDGGTCPTFVESV